jgi:predicted Zn finger-like uncharacterized protein
MAHMADDELEPLITECPSCHTRFRVAEAQLGRAGGKVRCGACLTVFHGVEHLTLESAQAYADDDQARQALDDVLDELAGDAAEPPGSGPRETPAETPAKGPAGAAAAVPFRDRQRQAPPIFAGFEEPEGESEGESEEADITPTFQVVDGPSETIADTTSEAPSVPPEDAAEPAAAAPASRPGAREGPAAATTDKEPLVFGERPPRRPLIWVGIALGLVLLTAQVLWYRFDDWAKDPQWQRVYGPLCQVLGCELPQQRDHSLLVTRNLAVRTHPSEADALQVNAMIVNRADFPQPFPVLELRFTTVRGTLVAGRRFEPAEYLGGDAAGMDMMPPRTPVQIELTMDDPGPEAVNYFLRIR